MADESDVETTLASLAFAALYPSGSGSPSVVTVDGGVTFLDGVAGRGWPEPQSLRAELFGTPSRWNVSIFARNGVERNATRYSRDFLVYTPPAPHTITAVVSGNTITIGGTVTTPQNVLVLCGLFTATSYSVQAADTLNSIATGVAALLAVPFPGTTSTGPVVTVAGHPGIMTARVATSGAVYQEVARIDKSFQVTAWAPTPAIRDAICKLIMPALIQPTFLTLFDGKQKAFCRYERSIQMDLGQTEGVYRRDLFFWVEYPTIITQTAYEIGTVIASQKGGQGPTSGVPRAPAVPSYN